MVRTDRLLIARPRCRRNGKISANVPGGEYCPQGGIAAVEFGRVGTGNFAVQSVCSTEPRVGRGRGRFAKCYPRHHAAGLIRFAA